MKAILLSVLTGVLFLGVMTLALRRLPERRRSVRLTVIWLASVPVLALAYLLTPPDLGFLPAPLQDDPPWFGLVFCLGMWTAGCFGGLLQLYNLAERGLSLRLLIEIDRASKAAGARGPSVDAVMDAYSDGRGIGWMFGKRLSDLESAGLIRQADGWVAVTPAARSTARRLSRMRVFLRLGGWT